MAKNTQGIVSIELPVLMNIFKEVFIAGYNKPLECMDQYLEEVKSQYVEPLSINRGFLVCPECGGSDIIMEISDSYISNSTSLVLQCHQCHHSSQIMLEEQ